MENINKKIVIGLFAGLIATLFSVLISDMHTVADIIIFASNGSYHFMQLPIYITGFIAGPIVVVSLNFFGIGFRNCWKKDQSKISKLISVVIFVYAFTQLLLCFADIHYANTIATHSNTTAMDLLIVAGTLRGFAALLVGVIGGIVLIPLFMIYFRRKNNFIMAFIRKEVLEIVHLGSSGSSNIYRDSCDLS